MAFLGDGSKYGIKINYSLEEEPLGTVAPVKLISGLPENFLVMNGDLLTDLDFRNYIIFIFHIRLCSRFQHIIALPKLILASSTWIRVNRVKGFREKPEYSFNVSMGVYVMNRKVLDHVPTGIPFGFDNLMLGLLEKNCRLTYFHTMVTGWISDGPMIMKKPMRILKPYLQSFEENSGNRLRRFYWQSGNEKAAG